MDFVFTILRILVAGLLLFAATSKLFGVSRTRVWLHEFGVADDIARGAAWGIPITELLIGILVLWPETASLGLASAYALFNVFTAAVAYNLLIGRRPACNCFGQLTATPISNRTLVRNLALMTITAIAFSGTERAELLFLFGTPLAAAIFLTIALIRLLLAKTRQTEERVNEIVEILESELGVSRKTREGLTKPGRHLPIGAPAPSFELDGVDGTRKSLADILAAGKTSILLFMSPDCGPCSTMMTEVEEWISDFEDNMSLAVISKGNAEKNQKKFGSTRVPILLQRESEVSNSFRAKWTPAAIAISSQGSISSNVAFGSLEVRSLIKHLASAGIERPWTASHPEAFGASPQPKLEIGQDLPLLKLQARGREQLDLARIQGKKTVLLFWSSDCGFCEGMVEDLAAWTRRRTLDSPALVVISSGPPDKRLEGAIGSTVLGASDDEVNAIFGTNGTPSAILIDAQGRIASTIGVGADDVFALLGYRPEEDL